MFVPDTHDVFCVWHKQAIAAPICVTATLGGPSERAGAHLYLDRLLKKQTQTHTEPMHYNIEEENGA